MKRLCIWVLFLLSGLLTLQAQESGPHSPRILGLDCGSNLSSLDVSGCTALTYLDCGWTGLSSLDVSGCTSLTYLNCYRNQLSSLDVSGFTSLTYLRCNDNPLSSLDVSGCTALKDLGGVRADTLRIYGESMDTLTLRGGDGIYESDSLHNAVCKIGVLDAAGCTTLRQITCTSFREGSVYYYGSIGRLNLQGCTSLTSLDCRNNKLTELDVRGCTALTSLNCRSNELTELDVSGCMFLTSLDCRYNKLTELDVSGCTALASLDCYGNKLRSLDVSGCTALNSLDCVGNQLNSLDVSGCTALTSLRDVHADTLRIQGESMPTLTIESTGGHSDDYHYYHLYYRIGVLDASGCTSLRKLTLTHSSYNYDTVNSLKLQGCTALDTVSCSSSRLTSLDVSGCTSLTSLECSWNQLSSLDVSGCMSLTSLDCYGNKLSSLDVSGCTALNSLDCVGNQLNSLDVSGCTSLKKLEYVSAGTLRIYGESMDTLTIGRGSFGVLDAAGCTTLRQITSGDYTSIGRLNLQGCTALTSLDCSGNRLSSLDVRGCTALTSLDCGGNQLSSLDMRGFTALTSLKCSYNQLSSLDVSGCTALTSLDCRDNKLTELDVRGCTALTSLDCSSGVYDGPLSSLDVRGCTALTSLDCRGNQLSSLDVSGCTALTSLNCSGASYRYGQLSSLNVRGCTALTSLDCRYNQLSSLDVSGCTSLTSLDCRYNQLSSLDVSGCTALTSLRGVHADTLRIQGESMPTLTMESTGGYGDYYSIGVLDASGCTSLRKLTLTHSSYNYDTVNSLKLQGCTALDTVSCSNSRLTSLDVSGCTALTSLDCSGASYRYGQLSSIDVSGCTALTSLNCRYNQLSSIDVSGCTALTSLDCYGNKLSSLDVSGCTSLTNLNCNGNNSLSSLDMSGCTSLTNLNCNGNMSDCTSSLLHLNVSGCTALTSLDWSGSKLRTLDVNGCTSLTNLNCNGNNSLSSLDVNGCTALTSLDCSNNQLSSLDVSANTALTSLDCSYNQLSSLDVSGCTALTSLSCYGNKLSSLDMSGCTSLKKLEDVRADTLRIYGESMDTLTIDRRSIYCEIGVLDAAGCTTLRQITFGGVSIERLNLRGCTALTSLDCSGSDYKLSSIDVSGCSVLTSLNCRNNQLTELDLSGCTALTSLNCRNNQLTELDLSGCTALTSLNCGGNQLISLDVSANTALTSLDCSGSDYSRGQLSSIDVSANTALTSLNCSYNQLSSLDVSKNTLLSSLGCAYNSISLSMLYKAYIQNSNWKTFSAYYQSDSITMLTNRPFDLSSERIEVGQSSTYFYMMDGEHSIPSSSDSWTQDGFVFQFHKPGNYRLDLYNNDISASFTWHVSVEVPRYTVQVASNNSGWGTAVMTGSGTYEEGTQVTITATPKEGYRFVDWTRKDGSVFSTETVHMFAVMENLELTANFEEVPRYTVEVASNNSGWGTATMTGAGIYEEGTQVTITATPNDGYRFVNWTRKDGSVFSTETVHMFAVMENLELTANFEEVPRYTVQVASNNPGWGTATMTGNGTYEEGSQVTITATSKEGYRFVNWTKKDGSVFSTEAVHMFAVMENLELTANFEEVPRYTVQVASNNPGWGTATMTGSGTYEEGTQVTITATPNEGYRFVNWTRKDGTVFATEAVHTFTVTENLELTANFEKILEEVENFTVVLAANNNAYGRVSQSGNGTYEEGSQVTITATPNNGYRFVNWTRKNGTVFATEAVHTFMVTENVELTANFEKKPDVANESREDDGFYVYVQDHTIHLSAWRGVARVYNAAGVCVYSGQSTAIPVQSSGLYIVRIGERAYKAMVR